MLLLDFWILFQVPCLYQAFWSLIFLSCIFLVVEINYSQIAIQRRKLQGHGNGMSITESVTDATLATAAEVICGVHRNLMDKHKVDLKTSRSWKYNTCKAS